MHTQELEANLGKTVKLQGLAVAYKVGAAVQIADDIVLIESLDDWPGDVRSKQVIAEGLLGKMVPHPQSRELLESTTSSEFYRLSNVKWSVVGGEK